MLEVQLQSHKDFSFKVCKPIRLAVLLEVPVQGTHAGSERRLWRKCRAKYKKIPLDADGVSEVVFQVVQVVPARVKIIRLSLQGSIHLYLRF